MSAKSSTQLLTTVIDGSVQAVSDTYGKSISIRLSPDEKLKLDEFQIKHKITNKIENYKNIFSTWVGIEEGSVILNTEKTPIPLEKKLTGKFQVVTDGKGWVLKKCIVEPVKVEKVNLTSVEDLI